MVTRILVVVVLIAAIPVAAQTRDPELDAVLAKVGAYVGGYGDRASLIVAVERYTQSVMLGASAAPAPPRTLVAEFAIIKTSDHAGWIGFRDVVEVDGAPVHDRRDRLMALFTKAPGAVNEAARIADEGARFNVGPVTRNFNVPTSALFFFLPHHLPRFTFTRKGTKNLAGVSTWEIAFKEVSSPTFVMTGAGTDVPADGRLWVNPIDGTVVRTRLHLANFVDHNFVDHIAPPSADVEVTYRRHDGFGLWLPGEMVEFYVGPVTELAAPAAPRVTTSGRATTRATYSDFKQFDAAMKIVAQ